MRYQRWLAVAVAGLLPAFPAHAAFDWWMIHGWGEAPARTLVFVDADSVRDREGLSFEEVPQTYRRAEAQLAFEAADGPDYKMFTFDIDCGAATIRENLVSTAWRDTRFETTPISHIKTQRFIRPAPDDWKAYVVSFACNEASRLDGQTMFHMGRAEIHPVEIAWRMWPDTPRPEYTFTKSFEEMKAENEALQKSLSAQMNRDRVYFEGLIAEDNEVQARREARMAKWPKRGLDRALYTDLLEPYIGFTEQDLVARWGAPKTVREYPGARLLDFEYGYDTVTYSHRGVLGHGESGREQHRCYVTFGFRHGKAIDYGVSGNYCREALSGRR